MKKIKHIIFLTLFTILSLILWTCKKEVKEEKEKIHVQGIVLNKITKEPINGAIVKISSVCAAGSGGIMKLSSSNSSDYTNGETKTGINGTYDLEVEIGLDDKDCHLFSFEINYSFNGYKSGDAIYVDRGADISNKVTELYLKCNLFINTHQSNSSLYEFIGAKIVRIDTTTNINEISYQYCNPNPTCRYNAICDAKNYIMYRIHDLQQNIIFDKLDSITCNKNKDQYYTIYY